MCFVYSPSFTQHLPDQLSFSMHPILLSPQVQFVLCTQSWVYGLLMGLVDLLVATLLRKTGSPSPRSFQVPITSQLVVGFQVYTPQTWIGFLNAINKNTALSGQLHSQWLTDTSINFKSILLKRIRTSMCCLLPILKYYWNNHKSMFESPVSCVLK